MSLLDLLYEFRFAYASALLETLKLCGIGWVCGVTVGTLLSYLAYQDSSGISVVLRFLYRLAESIPILVLLFWLHYPAQAIVGVVVHPFITTAVLLAIINTLAVYRILSAALQSVPNELIEAYRYCGKSEYWGFKKVVFPLAWRDSLGTLTSAQINVLQLSIFGGLISVDELFRVSQRINAEIYEPIQVYSILALFFILVCFPLHLLSERLTKKFNYRGQA